jgi:hypothetical protein
VNAQDQRRAQLAIRANLLRRWVPLWQMLDPKRLDRAFPAWLAAVVPVVQDHRKASAILAAQYLRDLRREAGIDGTAPVQLASVAPVDQLAASLSATSLAAIRSAFGNGQSLEQAMRSGFVASSGAASRLALQGGRDTVVDTVRADPEAKGWERVTSGDPCAFCALLASRGGVFRSEESADFEAHDHCSCSAEPVYSGSLMPHGDAATWDRLYQDHAAGTRDQLKNFRRAYEGRATS